MQSHKPGVEILIKNLKKPAGQWIFIRKPVLGDLTGHWSLFHIYRLNKEHLVLNIINNTNCLVYQYWYGPIIKNWLPVFLENVKTTGMNKNFIVCCRYFPCMLLSLFPCEILIYLPIAWWLNIFLFFVVWGFRVIVVSWIQKAQEEWLTTSYFDGELT